MNMMYARRDERGRFTFAPDTLTGEDGRVILRPTAAQYLAANWKTYFPPRPPKKPPREGYHWEQDGWNETDAAFTPKWKMVKDAPPPPKVYSTSDLIYALMARGVYQQCREWIAERGYLDLVLATKEFTGDMENFKTIRKGLQELLSYTDEEVAEVLAEAEVG